MTRLEELENQIKKEKKKQNKCEHKWGEPYRKTFIEKEEVLTGEYEYQGVHMWPKSRIEEKEVKKWVRVCQHCEKMDVTNKEKTKVVTTGPDFS